MGPFALVADVQWIRKKSNPSFSGTEMDTGCADCCTGLTQRCSVPSRGCVPSSVLKIVPLLALKPVVRTTPVEVGKPHHQRKPLEWTLFSVFVFR